MGLRPKQQERSDWSAKGLLQDGTECPRLMDSPASDAMDCVAGMPRFHLEGVGLG